MALDKQKAFMFKQIEVITMVLTKLYFLTDASSMMYMHCQKSKNCQTINTLTSMHTGKIPIIRNDKIKVQY